MILEQLQKAIDLIPCHYDVIPCDGCKLKPVCVALSKLYEDTERMLYNGENQNATPPIAQELCARK